MPQLTFKQLAVLAFLREFQHQHGSMPTHLEISQHFGWTSANAATDHLIALVARGAIVRTPGVSRGLRITDAGMALLGPAPGRQEFPNLLRLPVVDPLLVRRAAA